MQGSIGQKMSNGRADIHLRQVVSDLGIRTLGNPFEEMSADV